MAPMCPEEVDVFTVPHSRMKELVYRYLDMLTCTNFSNVRHLTMLLENLIRTFREFIAHEQIENRFIMKKLKHKLRQLSIQNTAVCNCHKDNQLLDMLSLLEDGYRCTKKSAADRINYGLQLRGALQSFTDTFLPHMAEEEEVFQPLLMQYFTVDELKQIKATVIQQHFKVEEDVVAKDDSDHEEEQEKFVHDNTSESLSVSQPPAGCGSLPDEVMMKIFSHLDPRDLCRSAQVSHRWNRLALDGSLWTHLYPVSWAKGDWEACGGVYEEDSQDLAEKLEGKRYDEDADVDEAAEDWDSEAQEIQHQSMMLTAICKHLLPRVGLSVRLCDLAYSKGITNGSLYKILSLCPNLEYLSLVQTRVSDLGFKGLQKDGCGQKLNHLDLSGCLYITDTTLQRLSAAMGQLPCHMTQADDHVTQAVDHVTQAVDHVTQTGDNVTTENTPAQLETSLTIPGEGHVRQEDDNMHSVENCVVETENCLVAKVSVEQNRCDDVKVEQTNDKKDDDKGTNETVPAMFGMTKATKVSCDGDQKDRAVCGFCRADKSLKDKQTSCNGTVKVVTRCGMKTAMEEHRPDNVPDITKPKTTAKHVRHGSCHADSSPNMKTTSCNEQMKEVINDCCGRGCGKKPEQNDSRLEHGSDRNKPKIIDITTTRGCQDNINPNLIGPPGHDIESPLKEGQCLPMCRNVTATSENERSQTYNDPHLYGNGQQRNNEVSSPVNQLCGTTDRSTDLDIALVPIEPKLNKIVSKDHGNPVDPQMISDLSYRNPLVEIVDKNNWYNRDAAPGYTFLPEVIVLPDRGRSPDLDINLQVTEVKRCDTDYSKVKDTLPAEIDSGRFLEFLSLSGCYQLTNEGIQSLTDNGGLPHLTHLDLSGCPDLGGDALCDLVSTAMRLEPSNLFYCDNIMDGPYPADASGCQNLQCPTRVCCRDGE